MDRFVWRGQLAKEVVRQGARAAIVRTANEVLEASLAVVPRETDELAESAGTSLADYQPVGTVYYDDPRDVKTIVQHEDLSQHHPQGESAKFLERPVRAAAGAFESIVGSEIRKGLR